MALASNTFQTSSSSPLGLPSPADSAAPPYHSYARFVAGCTAVLIFVGALVTSTGSGLAVPDWPLSFGTLFPAMVGGVRYEHGHRLFAGGVGLLTVVLGIWTLRVEHQRALRLLAGLAMAAVLTQACIGGLTVLLKLPPAVSAAHATVGQTFFCLVVALAMCSSPAWREAQPSVVGGRASLLRGLAAATTAAVWLQLVVGAVMRHRHAGFIFPDFPTSGGLWVPELKSLDIMLNFGHRFGALVVSVLALSTVAVTVSSFLSSTRGTAQARMLWAAVRLGCFVLLQVCLGAVTVWYGRPVVPTSLHVVNGALVLVTSLVVALWSWRALASGQGTEPSSGRG
jgi:heme a synthase